MTASSDSESSWVVYKVVTIIATTLVSLSASSLGGGEEMALKMSSMRSAAVPYQRHPGQMSRPTRARP